MDQFDDIVTCVTTDDSYERQLPKPRPVVEDVIEDDHVDDTIEQVMELSPVPPEPRVSTRPPPVFTEEPVRQKYPVRWKIKGFGSMTSNYRKVAVGSGCILLTFRRDDDNVFMPEMTDKDSRVIYEVTTQGKHFTAAYTGMKVEDLDGMVTIVLVTGVRSNDEETE